MLGLQYTIEAASRGGQRLPILIEEVMPGLGVHPTVREPHKWTITHIPRGLALARNLPNKAKAVTVAIKAQADGALIWNVSEACIKANSAVYHKAFMEAKNG